MYGTSVCLPTSVETEQPSAGAEPPLVFRRWTKVVLLRSVPPVGPVFRTDWSPATGRQSSPYWGNSEGRSRRESHSHEEPLPTPCCYRRSSATSRCRRAPASWGPLGFVIRAQKVGDDLNVLPEEFRKEGGFRAGAVDGPGSGGSARARRQANISLRTQRVAHQECCVPRRRRNERRRGWRRDGLCRRVVSRTEETSE